MRFYNSIIAELTPEKDSRNRDVYKGIYVVTFTLSQGAGGFPNFKSLIESLGNYILRGGPADTYGAAKAIIADQKEKQEFWFNSLDHLVDLNEHCGKASITSNELFKALVDLDFISMEHAKEHADGSHSFSDYLKMGKNSGGKRQAEKIDFSYLLSKKSPKLTEEITVEDDDVEPNTLRSDISLAAPLHNSTPKQKTGIAKHVSFRDSGFDDSNKAEMRIDRVRELEDKVQDLTNRLNEAVRGKGCAKYCAKELFVQELLDKALEGFDLVDSNDLKELKRIRKLYEEKEKDMAELNKTLVWGEAEVLQALGEESD